MTTVTVEDVLAAAETLDMEGKRELNRRLCDLIREDSRYEARAAALQFRVGDLVSFVHSKTRAKISGRVTKIGPKNIQLESKQGKLGLEQFLPVRWTVHPALLKKEA